MSDEQEISAWFNDDLEEETEAEESSVQHVMQKARSSTAQKDTMDLVFVKIWAAMLVLLAPLFASTARRQAGLGKQQTASGKQTPDTLNPPEQEDR